MQLVEPHGLMAVAPPYSFAFGGTIGWCAVMPTADLPKGRESAKASRMRFCTTITQPKPHSPTGYARGFLRRRINYSIKKN